MAFDKPKTAIEKKTRTVTDTIVLTPESVAKWNSPPFQRPISENKKVLGLAESLRQEGGVIRGVITLGILDGKTYILDGQHRIRAFLISGINEAFTDVRIHYCDSMAAMGEEFVLLNTQLVRMKPDDILRGMEESVVGLQKIRQECPYVGYDLVRRGSNTSPVVSMSSILRCWKGSSMEVPTTTGVNMSSISLSQTLTEEDADHLISFLKLAFEAFGRDPEYARLWGALNMVLCMWLYRRMVLSQYSAKTPRLTKEQFKKCLMSLSADHNYCDWLVGRAVGERDRSPAYTRIKQSFVKRLEIDMNKKVMMPQPAWHSRSNNAGG